MKVEDSKPIVKNEVSSSQTEGFESDNNSIAVQKWLLQSDQKKTKDIYNQTSATNEYFSEYPCFYCGFAIKSRSCLTEHSALCEELAYRDRFINFGESDCRNGGSLIHYSSENKKEPTMNEARLISSINRKWKQESTSVISAMYNNHGMHRVFTHSKSLKLDGPKKNEWRIMITE